MSFALVYDQLKGISYLGLILICSLILFCISCTSDQPIKSSGFVKLDSSSGFNFDNALDENNLKNFFYYVNVYCGGGVAIGDINNDGLQDVFMTGNMTSSKLYLNKGNMSFEDITSHAGVKTDGWSTGVTMSDVNNDGWLDIYVCRSYHDDPNLRRNKLFMNQKNGTFVDVAHLAGLDDANYSIGASFFDYDRDGDLDLLVANHPKERFKSLAWHHNLWQNPELEHSSRLFRNDRNTFKDVTEESGILSYGFCLSLTTVDMDNDGWQDVYITVDHDEPDILFHNNGDGTFTNIIGHAIKTSSLSSMGVDAGDINHDKYPDLFVAEMLSEDHFTEKVNMSMQNVDRFNYLVDTLGYKYFQMHNFLFLNNGNMTFSDISQLAHVHKTDWSWSTLFMDYDNDSWQDIYVTNGLFRNLFNRDKKMKLDSMMLALDDNKEQMWALANQYVLEAPQNKIKNYLFKNEGNLQFSKYTDKAGLTDNTISTGASYGDLDNDGDLDLVVNNVGDKAMMYENKSSGNNYLRVKFETNRTTTSMGSKVFAYIGDELQSRELNTTRGFQSSSENLVHFGLGDATKVDKLEVIWPNGKQQVLKDVSANQVISIKYENAQQDYTSPVPVSIVNTQDASQIGIDFEHQENFYRDYDVQVLLPHKLSEYGPFSTVGDVDGDGKEDIFIGAPAGQAGAIFRQKSNGQYEAWSVPALATDSAYEDGHSALVDIDQDGDLDLIVASTGYEFEYGDPLLQPRVYLNDGNGQFAKSLSALPDHKFSSSCISVTDFDKDGDMDIFIGGRLNPRKYPEPGTSGLFINDGQGKFTNEIDRICPELKNYGMIKDALWTDLNQDGQEDLIVVGEWTAISFFIKQGDKLLNQTSAYFSDPLLGWWNCIYKTDIDQDGLPDYVVGNLGTNYKYVATKEKPFIVYAKDFDRSGSSDIVLGTYYGDKMYPVRGRSCSSEQIPQLKEKFPSFEEYALADINDVYGQELNDALKYEVTEFSSVILFGEKDGTFTVSKLPREAQIAPVNGVVARDVNKDGKMDLVVGGNFYQSEIETGRADSGTGNILINMGDRTFKNLPVYQSGLYLPQDVKSFQELDNPNKSILVGINNDKPLIISFKN